MICYLLLCGIIVLFYQKKIIIINNCVVKKKRTGMGNEHEPDHNRNPGKKCKRNQDKSSVGIAKVLLHFLKDIFIS